jgi:tRNA(fMet)-specific endonuclease VapC
MKFLLDTNVCISALRGHTEVCRRLAAVRPGDCAVSMVTVYELLSGVERCRHPESERRKVETFLGALHLLPFDYDSAAQSARIRWDLERIGQPIGPYDLMLAGQAVAVGIVLVTHNTDEFQRVSGLAIEDWE